MFSSFPVFFIRGWNSSGDFKILPYIAVASYYKCGGCAEMKTDLEKNDLLQMM